MGIKSYYLKISYLSIVRFSMLLYKYKYCLSVVSFSTTLFAYKSIARTVSLSNLCFPLYESKKISNAISAFSAWEKIP